MIRLHETKIVDFCFNPFFKNTDHVEILPNMKYSDELGYGFDYETLPDTQLIDTDNYECLSSRPFYFSVKLKEGNYNISITFGSNKSATWTTVKAQSRRLLFENIQTLPSEFLTYEVSVNIKTPLITNARFGVDLRDREHNKISWSNKLTLEFNGPTACVSKLKIEKANDALTLFVAGNSTVVDHDDEPYASWPQLITSFLARGISVSNHAESGLTLKDFIAHRRLDKVLSTIKAGDYFFIEFGHLDKKDKSEDALDYFRKRLLHMIWATVKKKGIPVLVTPINRCYLDSDDKVINTLGEYPELIREIASTNGVKLIDLHARSKEFYELLGLTDCTKAFVHYPPNTWPNQPDKLKDNTHLNVYGAYQIAKLMLSEIEEKLPELTKFYRKSNYDFTPSMPDEFDWNRSLKSPLSPVASSK